MSPIENNPALVPPGGLASLLPRRTRTPARTRRARCAGGAADQSSPTRSTRPSGRRAAAVLAHALARVQRRGIELDPGDARPALAEGVGRAASKGSRDSLVLVDGTAFVVSVSNRTVITAVGSEHMKENVFTNIDSAVIA